MPRLITADQVKDNLSFLERVTDIFSSTDEYKQAMLDNQIVQTRILSDMAGVGMGDHLDPGNVDMDDLPRGIVGTSESVIERNDTGRAVFDISGSKYEATVRAEADIEENETVVISSSDNHARPSDSAQDALSVMVGSGEAGRNAVMRSQDMGLYDTSDLDSSNDLGSIVMEPGEEETIAHIDQADMGGYLLGCGAYNERDVEYSVVVDGEHSTFGWMNTPLGNVSTPFWFSDTLGGVVKFTEEVEYVARYSDSASGQVELTASLYTQEF